MGKIKQKRKRQVKLLNVFFLFYICHIQTICLTTTFLRHSLANIRKLFLNFGSIVSICRLVIKAISAFFGFQVRPSNGATRY